MAKISAEQTIKLFGPEFTRSINRNWSPDKLEAPLWKEIEHVLDKPENLKLVYLGIDTCGCA